LLAEAVERHENASGSNQVSICVHRDHRVEVKLVSGSSSEFNEATLEAYRALDGNPALGFPEGSKRHKVMFFVDNNHSTSDQVSGVFSKTISGDIEEP
jgi:hypothetical protein